VSGRTAPRAPEKRSPVLDDLDKLAGRASDTLKAGGAGQQIRLELLQCCVGVGWPGPGMQPAGHGRPSPRTASERMVCGTGSDVLYPGQASISKRGVRGRGPLFHRRPWEAVEGVGAVVVRDLGSTDAKAMSARMITALPIAIAVALMPQDADRTPAAMAGTLVER
jgi:hypothetical protein